MHMVWMETIPQIHPFTLAKSFTTFKKLKRDEAKVSVCVSLESDSSETVEVIIVKLCTVTPSDMRINHI